MTSDPRQNALKCLEAVRGGKREDWNAWVEANPICNIDFSGMNLSDCINKNTIDFSGFYFPTGFVDFTQVNFGDCNVSFENTKFGDGDVLFYKAQFGQWDISFDKAEFGDGEICFKETNFSKGSIWFVQTQFGTGNIEFYQTQLGKKGIIFFNSDFGKGNLIFFPVGISQCKLISFCGSSFECTINMEGVESPCVIDLTQTKMDYPIDFDRSNIGYDPSTYDKDTATSFRRLKKLAKDAEDHDRALDFYAKEIRSSYDYALKEKHLIRYAYKTYDFFSDFGRSFSRPFICLILNMIFFSCIYKIQQMDSLGIYFYNLSFLLLLISVYLFITTRLKNITLLFGLVVSIIFSGHYLKVPPMFSSRTFALSATYSLPFYSASITGRTALEDMVLPSSGHNEKQKEYYRPKRKRLAMTGIIQGIISSIFLFLMGLALRNRFRS